MIIGDNFATISWIWDPSHWFPSFCWSWSQEESTGAKPLSESISERDVRNLHKTLARMNFSNLICLVTHQSPNRAGLFPESAERLSAALERLRPRLSPMRGLETWMLRRCCGSQCWEWIFAVWIVGSKGDFPSLKHRIADPIHNFVTSSHAFKGLYSAVPLWFLSVASVSRGAGFTSRMVESFCCQIVIALCSLQYLQSNIPVPSWWLIDLYRTGRILSAPTLRDPFETSSQLNFEAFSNVFKLN